MVKYISRTNVWLFGCFSLPSRFGGVCVGGGESGPTDLLCWRRNY